MNENTMMGQQDGSEGKNATSTLNYLSSTHRTHVQEERTPVSFPLTSTRILWHVRDSLAHT